MFSRPSSKMTIQEYYEGERHCILVTASDPIARRMLVTVPMIEEGQLFQLNPLNVDWLEVAQMFGQVLSSKSILTFLCNHDLLFILTICSCYDM